MPASVTTTGVGNRVDVRRRACRQDRRVIAIGIGGPVVDHLLPGVGDDAEAANESSGVNGVSSVVSKLLGVDAFVIVCSLIERQVLLIHINRDLIARSALHNSSGGIRGSRRELNPKRSNVGSACSQIQSDDASDSIYDEPLWQPSRSDGLTIGL